MSCYDWRRLVAHRFSRQDLEPPGWDGALAHLDGCPRCREEALAADPTLLFRHLPAVEATADEVEAMRQGVALLRRSAALERRRTAGQVWVRRAALLAFLLGVLALLPGGAREGREGFASPEAMTAAAPSSQPQGAGSFERLPTELTLMPVVEAVDRPGARIYHLGGQEISVVLIVDESLDV